MEPSLFFPLPVIPDDLSSLQLTPLARFCIERHAVEKYGLREYSFHLWQVVIVLRLAGAPEYVADSGWAHDIFESKLASREEVEQRSSKRTADIAWAVSGFGINRKERLLCVLPKIADDPDAGLLKLADRYVNVVNCILEERWGLLSVYLREHEAISAVFPGLDHPLRQAYESAITYAYQCLSLRHHQVRRMGRP